MKHLSALASWKAKGTIIQHFFWCVSLQINSIRNGAQEVEEKASSQEENDREPGRPVHLPLLQPREILRC